jgi:hypothetical protein
MRDILTLDRMLTGQVIHLVYWAGLCFVAIVAFAVVGAAFGSATDGGLQALLLALVILVVGLLVVVAMGLLWRSFCEFYLTIFRIGQDLSALRAASEAGVRPPGLDR